MFEMSVSAVKKTASEILYQLGNKVPKQQPISKPSAAKFLSKIVSILCDRKKKENFVELVGNRLQDCSENNIQDLGSQCKHECVDF